MSEQKKVRDWSRDKHHDSLIQINDFAVYWPEGAASGELNSKMSF